MKKTLLLLFPLLLFATSDAEKRLIFLENEMKNLKTEMKYHQDDLDERMPIIEKIEKKSILDKINFSPELELRMDKMDYKLGEIANESTLIYSNSDNSIIGEQRRDQFSKDFDIATSIRFRLNMDATINDNIHFYGRMVFNNSSQSNQRLCILSRDIKSAESSSALDIDRAYVNYTANKNSDNAFTFSFGLLPTTGGTPMQFAKGNKRQSMFPALVFDMNTYGIIGTQKINSNTFVRAIFAKAYTMRASFYPYQCNRENIDNANVIGIYADTKFNFLGNSLLSFGVNMLQDLKAHPYLGPDVGSSDSHVLGDTITLGLGLDIQKFAKQDLTFFVHTALSSPHGNSKKDNYQIAEIKDDDDGVITQTTSEGKTELGITGFSEADYAQGKMLKDTGYSIYIGSKYNFTKYINFGAEYNYGSKYWFSATQGAEDMYNKLATRGHVGEFYAIWNLHKKIKTKLGYMYSKEKFTGSGWHFGEPAKKDGTQKIVYLTLNAKF